ncbi:MAG: cytochrome c [Acidobacteriota bacterium]|nr:cytochrome c [Acidobacteriota bacterium]
MRLRWAQSVAAILLASMVAGCRQDMHDQPKYIPMRASDFYPDKRSERPYVEGTVPAGEFQDGSPLYTGMVGEAPIDYFPMAITAADMKRGQQRYGIFCAPCHGSIGDGNGMIVQRGYRPPPSFHIDRLRTSPPGHYFDVITHGFGAMPDAVAQVSPQDRWRIIAYIRALQLSQHASVNDVPAAQRGKIKKLSDVGGEVQQTPVPRTAGPHETEVPR